ncbi:D-lactate ferricytochrome c oxidoreductase [Rhodotorula sphaerocarpa]
MAPTARRVNAIRAHLDPDRAPPAAPPPDWDAALAELKRRYAPGQLSLDLPTRAQHGESFGSLLPNAPPTAVVHAESTEDVVVLVSIATKSGIVLIPTGGRTALEGQFQASCCSPVIEPDKGPSRLPGPAAQVGSDRPVIHVSLSRMQDIRLYESDFQAVVGPGVGWKSLNEHLAARGIKLFFPVDPAPGAEFGGMAGVAGSGTNAVGYGTLRGKSTTGFDTARLFIGSEGTLGIVTELTVRLAPILPLKVALTSFPTVSQAVSTVISILSAGITPTSLELLDLLPTALPEEPTVLMRFANPDEKANFATLERVRGVVARHGGRDLRVARNEEENEQLWAARKITDVCVPISRLAEFVDRSETLVVASGLVAPIVAHIGDGNVHRAILWKGTPGETEPPETVARLAKQLVELAQELEGTCAGEHGVGVTKRKYLRAELGEGTLGLLRTVKRALDPYNLLNPGKVLLDEEEGAGGARSTEP